MSRALSVSFLQLPAAAMALAAVALAPPAQGAMLLVPLAGQDADSLATWATRAGTTIIGRGPLPGSLAVEGSRYALFTLALRHATLIVAAPPTACGSAR